MELQNFKNNILPESKFWNQLRLVYKKTLCLTNRFTSSRSAGPELSHGPLHVLRKKEMLLKFIKEIIFFFMTVVGMLGNISVSVNYMTSWWGGPEKKPIHLMLIHLTFTNIIILLAKGLPKTMEDFGLRNFLDDIGCKILIYLSRVARGVSICTSGLLTVVQAIIISPRASGWRRLRPQSAWHILPFFSFFWILNALLAMNLIHSITSTSLNISQFKNDENYCYLLLENQKIKWIVLPLMVLRDEESSAALHWIHGAGHCSFHPAQEGEDT
ncbi:putative vomeronasal receptor-like protein 4 [Microtus ochrogaster]|uniref:Vomeronasal type-1 receptor n=1 Tax=Microtus ochrogaster TaxID=79684 RepID=A0ABM1AXL6_MICOH|nr:putative vomeronasal receptor-like protein 4 [Microtus ochrogaster]